MPDDLLNRNFVAGTLIAAWRNTWIMLIVAVSTLVLEIIFLSDFFNTTLGFSVFALTTFVINSYLGVATHATLLQGRSGWASISTAKTVGMYVVHAFVLSSIFFVMSFGSAILIVGINAEHDVILGILFLLLTPTSWIVYALLGTMLPAIVVDGDFSVAQTIRRGRLTFFYALGRIAAGPGLLFIVSFLGVETFRSLKYTGDVLSVDQGFEIYNAVPSGIAAFLVTLNVIMFTVIISKAYVRGEKKLIVLAETGS